MGSFFDHLVEQSVDSLLDMGSELRDSFSGEMGFNHAPRDTRTHKLVDCEDVIRREVYLCCICCGGSMSTNVALFFAASFPPALISGNPGRVRS
jgi:hypothetical protein